MILPVQQSMEEPHRFPEVLRYVIILVTLIFAGCGALSYLAFGDDTSDVHNFTGSLKTNGSLVLNSYSVSEISNDTTLTDSSATALITENAAKVYVDSQTDNQQAYLRKQFVKTTSSITVPSTASFTAVTASAPTDLTATSENDFIFFINGQYMEHDAIQIQQAGSTLLLKVDNSAIGYDLEADDEILAVGKFNS